MLAKKIYVRYLRLNLWHPTVPNRYRICYNNETKKWGTRMAQIDSEMALNLLLEDAERIKRLIRNQENSLCIAQCKSIRGKSLTHKCMAYHDKSLSQHAWVL